MTNDKAGQHGIICRNDEPVVSRDLDGSDIVDPIDQQICEIVARTLQQHYPGHDWLIQADRKKGMIDIRNVSLDGALGCRIKMGSYATSSELEKTAMRYGGEILERFHVERGRLNPEKIDDLPLTFNGLLRADQ